MNSTDLIILFSILIIVSYLYSVIADYFKVPSVVLLIVTGMGLKFLSVKYNMEIPNIRSILEVMGTIGLILIVLEGSLELKITKSKLNRIGKASLAAATMLPLTIIGISAIIYGFNDLSIKNSLVLSIPISIISSAIAIPSVKTLTEQKKEFIVYESTLSDIIGIMIFNFAIADNILSIGAFSNFFIQLAVISIVSFLGSFILMLMLNFIGGHIKSFLILSVLFLVYGVGKLYHLPSLLLVLVFGIISNNINSLLKIGKINLKLLDTNKLGVAIKELKLITGELAFLIRTYFFLLFGFVTNINSILSFDVIITGTIIIVLILLVRIILLRFIMGIDIFPEIFIAPIGLITVILFYSIPAKYLTSGFNEGIITFVILASALILMLGLMFNKKAIKQAEEY